jgi:hypothetical protein
MTIKQQRPLELSPEQIQAMVDAVMVHIRSFVATLPEQKTDGAAAVSEDFLRSLKEPVPQVPVELETLLDLVFKELAPLSLNAASPGFPAANLRVKQSQATGRLDQPVINRLSRQKGYSMVRSLLLTLLMTACLSAGAEVEIHRCAQEDGTIAFQGTPCPEPANDSEHDAQDEDDATAPADDFFDFVNPFDEPEEAPSPSEPALPSPVSQDRAECEKTTRTAIDAIDLEMRQGYSKEKGQQFLAELLELTQQLRACKQL